MKIHRAVLFLMLGLIPSSSHSEENLADLRQSLKTQYLGKVITLRRFYCSSHLLFDADGNLLRAPTEGPWTTCARVEMEKLDLSNKKLTLQGRRIMLRYDRVSRSFIDVGKDAGQIIPLALPNFKAAERFKAEVYLKKEKVSRESLQAALDRIFLKDTENLADVAPPFWRLFLLRQNSPMPSDVNAWFSETAGVGYTVHTPGIVAPRQLTRTLPHYTELARMFRAEGIVLISGFVDGQGRVAGMQIVTPLGLGLDESAVYEIAKWQFEPGRRNGQPVPVVVLIETSFRLY